MKTIDEPTWESTAEIIGTRCIRRNDLQNRNYKSDKGKGISNSKPMRRAINSLLIVFVLAFLISWNSFLNPGPHGGRVETADDYFIEMKFSEKVLYVFLLDKKLSTISNKEITADVKLFFADSTTLDVPLKLVGVDTYTSETASEFYACKITFHLSGKTVTAKFDNPMLIAIKK